MAACSDLSIGIIEELTPTLAPAHVDTLCRQGVKLEFDRNQVIYRQGEPAEHICLLLRARPNRDRRCCASTVCAFR